MVDRDGRIVDFRLSVIRTMLGFKAFRNAAVTIAGVELIADGVRFLDLWFAQNPEVATTWPGDVIARRIREFMADGIITTEKLGHLQVTLSGLARNAFVGTGVPDGLPTKLPVNDEVHVAVPTCSFCFTGTFVFGMRGKCERAVIDLGGEATGNVTWKLHYLVIGSLASPDWINTSCVACS